MAEKKISKAWHKQYEKERQYDRDFKYAESKKSLKGGIDNPKNWRGGKWEMNHDPYKDRDKVDRKTASGKKTATSRSTKKRGRKKSAPSKR